ncbi:hypothetical protein [Photobacterium kishitanii]|uniref:hypothetical protein n=1 Tax=Photobacterium kishitanii TaxID=318456 RepID=UPI0005D3C4D0|nr:hypothetical protein [Photobacterium kishitanii]KJG64868.1 hypothetical protein UA40_14230 [Photobacterium kishitanii]
MIVSDYYQLYTLIIGAYMNTKMWEVLGLLGIPFLPFMFMLLKNVAKAQGQGIDEGKKSDLVLAYSIVDFIKMVLVVIFFSNTFRCPIIRYFNNCKRSYM